jgi:hypothetical protein
MVVKFCLLNSILMIFLLLVLMIEPLQQQQDQPSMGNTFLKVDVMIE